MRAVFVGYLAFIVVGLCLVWIGRLLALSKPVNDGRNGGIAWPKLLRNLLRRNDATS